jgi:Caspase domain/Bacterial SH3 domain
VRWFVVCVCLLCGCLPSPVAAASTLNITAPQANVRSGPGLTYQVLTAVPQGAIFPVLASQTGWHQIRLEDGREGWVAASAVRVDQGSRALSTAAPPVAAVPLQPDGTSWAVVIGINTYQHLEIPVLSYAVNDARSVAAALQRLGFTSERIFLLLDAQATRQGIENVLYDRLRAAGTNDRLFVFFAGHGETMALPHGDTEGFLLPHDANPRNLFTTAISMSDVRRIGQRIAAKHILFAVDACYSGFTVAQARSPQRVDTNYLRLILQDPAVQVITAGKSGEKVYEERGHGLFTMQLLKAFEGYADADQNGVLLATELAAFLQSRVLRDTEGKQHPQFGQLAGEGQFVFVLPPAGDPLPAPEVIQRPAPPEPPRPAVQRPQPEAAPPSSAAGQKPVEVAKLEEPRPQPAPLPSARRQEAIALLQTAIDADNVEITDQELIYTLRRCVQVSGPLSRRDEEFCGDVKHTISLSGLTVQETKAKNWLGPARILVASGGAVRRDILNFSEPAGARKFRIESELRSGREERGKEWIQLRAGVSLERVAEALHALSR